jgi:hypothetical protein
VHVRAFRGGVASADFAAADQCPSKSLGLNVFFPAWVWANNPDVDGKHPDNAIRKDCWLGPGVRFAYLSYDAELSTNHSIKCRQLIESPWYQDLWRERFCLTQSFCAGGHCLDRRA